jgi:hypothetical protein
MISTRFTVSDGSRCGQYRWTGNRYIFKVCGISRPPWANVDWITGSGVISSVDHEGDGGILVDKQRLKRV